MILKLVDGWFLEQPTWWQNFINDVDDRSPNELDYIGIKRKQFIIDEFAKVGASLINDEDEEIVGIEFNDDAKATWFIMRWS
jgi:hypothetical protein